MKIYPKMNSKNTALLVIDIVNGCCHKKCEDSEWGITFSKIRKMIPKLEKFIETFRKKVKGKVIFTTITPWTKKHLPKNLQELYTDPRARYYGEETTFDGEFYKVKPKKEDIVITKNNYDTFANPKFEKILKKNKIRYLVITGVFTDGCVLSTVVGGFSRGYNFIIIKDLIETTDVKVRRELCEHLNKYTFPVMYGRTMNLKGFLEGWQNNN